MKFSLAHYLKILGISCLTIFLLAACQPKGYGYAYPWYDAKSCVEVKYGEDDGIEDGVYCKVEVSVETPQQSPR